MAIKKILIPFLTLALVATACSKEGDETPFTDDNLPRANSTILPPGGKADRPEEAISFEEFLNYVFCEEDGRVCVVDGDTPVPGGIDNLRHFYDTRVQPSVSTVEQGLSVNLGERGDDLWYGDQRFDLSFCVSDDFGDRKAEVVEATLEAMAQWEELAAVKFPYREDQDHRCHLDNRQVLFPIWPAEPDAPYFARAFFPSSAEEERDIRINMAEFDAALNDPELSDITITGIMRHELGHVLGFRHEHTRDEADAYYCFEDRNYRPGTGYDSDSVMHYPQCEGTNDWSLPFSQTDIVGARYFYPEAGVEVLGRCEEELGPDGFVLDSCEPVVHQITEWLSKYNANTFLEWAGIPESIWERIQEESYVRPFSDLNDLKERTQILDEEIRLLYDYLFVDGRCPGWEFSEDQWVSPFCYPVINQMLYLANNATFEELNTDVGLDRRAVENIIAARQVRELDTYDALTSLGYVKRTALWAMYTYLYPNWESEQAVDDETDEPDPTDPQSCDGFTSNGLASPSCGAGPLTVTFNAAPLLGGLDYTDPTWDFGDGRTGRGVQVDHTYVLEGDYEATFTARVTGNGWVANMALGSINVRVLPEDDDFVHLISHFEEVIFDTPEIIPGNDSFISELIFPPVCEAQYDAPWISVLFDEGSRDQVDMDLLAPEPNQVFALWRGQNGASFHPLDLFSFPTEDQPVDSLDPIISHTSTGSWILEVTNISNEPVTLSGWSVDVSCPSPFNDLEYSVSDGLSTPQSHIGQFPDALTYQGYEDNETCSPGDSSYREFTIPDASSLQLTIYHQTELDYDFLKVFDLNTGDLLLNASGPEDVESADVSIVDVPSNTFAICVESDDMVNRPEAWLLADVIRNP